MEKVYSLNSPVQIYALGGLGEVGKNTYCIEDENDLIIIDAGVMFPEESIFGVNYVIPDYTHLKNVRSKIRALFITHGHEDHIGGIPFLLQNVFIPVIYAPKLAAALIRHKLAENNIRDKVKIVEIDEDMKVNIRDNFDIQFFHMTHSIPDCYGICVDTKQGRIMTTGDFKIDLTPVSKDISLNKIARLGDEGVDLLLSDSTNVEREGFTPSERSVISSIHEIFAKTPGRLIISTFSSNISRVQQIVEGCVMYKRKLVILGRSMESTINLAREYGYIKIPNSAILSSDNIKNVKSNELCIICTGSQGEPLAALSRIAHGEHAALSIQPGDTVVFSSSPIPGNTASVNKIVNQLTRAGATVLTNTVLANLHASGHPSKQELRLILKLVKPTYFMPVHGEYRMLRMHAELATHLGIPKENTFVMDNGDTLILYKHKITPGRKLPTDDIFLDGKDINGLSTAVIKDRELLSTEGVISVMVTIDSRTNSLLDSPKLVTTGFMYLDAKCQKLLDLASSLLEEELNALLVNKVTFSDIKNTIKNSVSKTIFEKTKRKPMIIPLIMNKIVK